MWLPIHALFSARTAEWSSSVPALAGSVTVLSIMREVRLVVATSVIEHGTISTIWMVVHLLAHVGGVIWARVVWVIIGVCAVLAAVTLTLLVHLVPLLGLVLLLAWQ